MNRDELTRGGQARVPCLRATDQSGNSPRMYESGSIIEYLRRRFATV